MKYLCPDLSFSCGVIHIVRRQKGGGGSSQMRTIGYAGGRGFQGCVRTQKKIFFFWTTKSQKFSFFCTKKAITLRFIIVYRKV